jgi:hypothetical protein
MNLTPKLTGDLRQRYVVSKQIDHWTWTPVGWANTRGEAESLERHFCTDVDALATKIIDRGEDGREG